MKKKTPSPRKVRGLSEDGNLDWFTVDVGDAGPVMR